MHRKPQIAPLNPHLTCKLCNGYFVDATTIIECLHTFCRSCIVQYLQTNKYCPVCDVQVHKTRPLLNIRPDDVVQRIVYKLVPKLLHNEVQRRRDFNLQNSGSATRPPRQLADLLLPDETVSLTLSYYGAAGSVRYLQCPAAVTCAHLQKLIRAKYGLFEGRQQHRVDIMYKDECLNPSFSLMDIAYIYLWKRSEPLELGYRIFEAQKVKNCVNNNNNEVEMRKANNNTWKEVQLRISENGEMSIIQEEQQTVNKENKAQTKLNSGTKRKIVEAAPAVAEAKKAKKEPPVLALPPPPAATPPPTSQLLKTNNNRPATPCYMPKTPPTIINVPKPSTSSVQKKVVHKTPPPAKTKAAPAAAMGYKTLRDPPKSWNSQISKAKPTMTTTTSSAQPTILNPIAMHHDTMLAAGDKKPAKFFKMRNNMPRYLGNPASGVKPMYQLHVTPEKDGKRVQSEAIKNSIAVTTTTSSSSEIKKHSIVKIDPKTLKPINEKAPDQVSLSIAIGSGSASSCTTTLTTTTGTTNQHDLKINTSSVSIFNPLKNNSAMKSERKSPKSPNKAAAGGVILPPPIPPIISTQMLNSSGGGGGLKRDKLNLNFMSNPFVPNLTSPTMGAPNSFLYPNPAAAGFPPYDPRVMAAYHNFLYGHHQQQQQRMSFSSGLNLDVGGGRKSFQKLPSPTIASAPGGVGPTSPKIQGKTAAAANGSSSSNSKSVKKIGEKSVEKSLQNAVEKLTQNRVKEMAAMAMATTATPNVTRDLKDEKVAPTAAVQKVVKTDSSKIEADKKVNNSGSSNKTMVKECEVVEKKCDNNDKNDGGSSSSKMIHNNLKNSTLNNKTSELNDSSSNKDNQNVENKKEKQGKDEVKPQQQQIKQSVDENKKEKEEQKVQRVIEEEKKEILINSSSSNSNVDKKQKENVKNVSEDKTKEETKIDTKETNVEVVKVTTDEKSPPQPPPPPITKTSEETVITEQKDETKKQQKVEEEAKKEEIVKEDGEKDKLENK